MRVRSPGSGRSRGCRRGFKRGVKLGAQRRRGKLHRSDDWPGNREFRIARRNRLRRTHAGYGRSEELDLGRGRRRFGVDPLGTKSTGGCGRPGLPLQNLNVFRMKRGLGTRGLRLPVGRRNLLSRLRLQARAETGWDDLGDYDRYSRFRSARQIPHAARPAWNAARGKVDRDHARQFVRHLNGAPPGSRLKRLGVPEHGQADLCARVAWVPNSREGGRRGDPHQCPQRACTCQSQAGSARRRAGSQGRE